MAGDKDYAGVTFPEKLGADPTVFIVPTEELQDAFGRLRMSQPHTIAAHKFLYDENPTRWHTVLSGNGSSAYIHDESSVGLTVTTTSGDKVVRQTALYYDYVPKKSHNITMTLVPGADEANRRQRWGYFDINNGVFFEYQDGSLKVVVRSNAGGNGPVDIPHDKDSEESYDGKKNFIRELPLDLTKAQICSIDFQWLGVGRVRYYFSVNGKLFCTAEVNHDNFSDGVYMATPNLPVRYEIENTGVCGAGTTMKQICSSVESEGGAEASGIEMVASNKITAVSVPTGGAYVPIIGIDLAQLFNTKEVRKKVEITGIKIKTTENLHVELRHHRNYTSTTGGSFVSVDSNISALRKNVALTAVTGGTIHIHHEDYPVVGGGPIKVGTSREDTKVFSEHSFLTRNYNNSQSELFVLWGTSLGAQSADVLAILDCFERD